MPTLRGAGLSDLLVQGAELMPWTAKVHQGGAHQLLVACESCGRPCYDVLELPTRTRICLTCVAEELAKAEDEIEVDQQRRFAGTTAGEPTG